MEYDVDFLMRYYHLAINAGASEDEAMYWAKYHTAKKVPKSPKTVFETIESPGRPTVLTDAKKTRAHEMRAAGYSLAEIAHELGCSKSTVFRLFSGDDSGG